MYVTRSYALCYVFCAGAKTSAAGDNTRFKHVSQEMFTTVISSQVLSCTNLKWIDLQHLVVLIGKCTDIQRKREDLNGHKCQVF